VQKTSNCTRTPLAGVYLKETIKRGDRDICPRMFTLLIVRTLILLKHWKLNMPNTGRVVLELNSTMELSILDVVPEFTEI
jgi:hypothetical protein